MDHYAVIGNPVEHSRSPDIHARFVEQTRQGLRYGRVLAPLDGFADVLRRFAERGLEDGGAAGRAAGCNITVPFKFEALQIAAHATARAQLAGAANVLRFDADGWSADNSDGIGLVRDIEGHAGRRIAGLRLLVIGAGGASSGALGPLLEARPAELVLANRSVDRARALVGRHAELARHEGVDLQARGLADCGRHFDLVINASASSLAGAPVPVAADVLAPGALALDMMYGAGARGFLEWAAAHGAVGRDGLGMLVEQAAEAFAFWRGVRPDTAEVLAALRARLQAEAAAAPT